MLWCSGGCLVDVVPLMLHPVPPFIVAAEASGVASCLRLLVPATILLFCCLDTWTALRSSIIVLDTVESLFIPFALSSIAYCLLVIFRMLLGMVFHARMIDVADFNQNS
ncbi:hypothetical protein SETIT_7G197100v2 [Setaria italica]|uniref:Uncharacterized protein n=1 Tax=Setaria italica TaxID=4555 RepID=A0A368RXV0_SETIT|nr:hypothetical protein SETIT_7G197100v2 [Setaria italica]